MLSMFLDPAIRPYSSNLLLSLEHVNLIARSSTHIELIQSSPKPFAEIQLALRTEPERVREVHRVPMP